MKYTLGRTTYEKKKVYNNMDIKAFECEGKNLYTKHKEGLIACMKKCLIVLSYKASWNQDR